MQDIDFEELDRAVNSVSDGSTASAAEPVVAPEPVSVSEPVVATTPLPAAPVSPAAKRSTGRFMDVVHPSSDMRLASTERTAPTPRPEVERPTPPPSEALTLDSSLSASDLPDPIDFLGYNPDPLNTSTPGEVIEEPATVEEPASPLESPFLSNAQVEKRPLGAFSTNEPVSDAPAFALDSESDTPLLEAPDAELLLEEEVDAPEISEDEVTAQEAEPTSYTSVSAPVEDVPQGPTSITQQYKEQSSTEEQPSGAIYDTEAYHQPLAHPVKKKSGILVVVWILGLIIVGAGAGAAVYFFVLPML